MELKPGYKQTDIGVIPDDWEVKKLEEIASVGSGGTPSRTNLAYWNGDIAWITTTQIDSNLIVEANEFITKAGLENSAAKIYQAGTLLMAMYGQGKTRGKVAILGIDAAINQACAAISLNKSVSHGYVFSNLAARYEEIRGLSNTGNQENLNSQIIKNILVPLPPLPEQRAIAAALSDMDALITALDRLIAKKRDIKQAAMQELLTGKRRLPGFSGEWEARTLAEVCLKIQDGTHFSPSLGGNDYLYVTSTNIGFGVLDVSGAGRIDAAQHRAIYSRCDVRRGDVLLTKDGVNTGNAALNHLDEEISLLSSVAFLRFDSRQQVAGYYLQQILSSQGQKQIKQLMSGNAITRLTLEKIRRLQFAVPSLPEQQAIAEVLSDMDAEIAALERKRDKTRLLKQGMMQELLTGRIRLV